MSPPPVVNPPIYYPSRKRGYQTVGRVVFAGVVLLVFGAVEAFGGAIGAVFAGAVRRAFDAGLRDAGIRIETTALPAAVAGSFVALLILGVLHLTAAAGVLSHKNWGRALGVLLTAMGIFVGGFALYEVLTVSVVRTPALLGALGVLIPYGVAFFALIFASDHFLARQARR